VTRATAKLFSDGFSSKAGRGQALECRGKAAILERLLLLLSMRGMAPDIMPVLGNIG